MLFVGAAKQHHHGHQEFAGKNRQRHAAGQSGFDRLVRALEIGICKFGEDDRMAGGPGFAGQPFVKGEQRVLADSLELRILVAAKAATEFQARAGTVGHPQFNDANESLHRHAPVATPISASAI
nr:hypothetical protein [Bradyrhizobium australiense]